MNTKRCPCCDGTGSITIMPLAKRPRGWLTLRQLAKVVDRTHQTVAGHMRAGLLHVVTGEWVAERTVRYLVPPAEVKAYKDYLAERQPFGKQASLRLERRALIMSDQPAAAIAAQLGLKRNSVLSMRARYKRIQAEPGYLQELNDYCRRNRAAKRQVQTASAA